MVYTGLAFVDANGAARELLETASAGDTGIATISVVAWRKPFFVAGADSDKTAVRLGLLLPMTGWAAGLFIVGAASLAVADINASPTLMQGRRVEYKLCGVWGTDQRSASESSSYGLQPTFARRLLHEKHCHLCLANGHHAQRCGHSRSSSGHVASFSVCDAASRWTRILRPRGSRADECTLLRCTSYVMRGWRHSSYFICSKHG